MPNHHAGPPIDVAALRTRLRAWRRALPADELERRAARVAAVLAAERWWSDAAAVAGYVATGGELDPGAALDEARSRGATTCVPVLGDESLRFAAVDDGTRWRPNRYGIDEPADPAGFVDVAAIDVVLVPAVAVDRSGNRVGMGAGWYDRTFAERSGAARPRLVGFVHTEQVVDGLDPAPWDVAVDVIVTPDGVTELG